MMKQQILPICVGDIAKMNGEFGVIVKRPSGLMFRPLEFTNMRCWRCETEFPIKEEILYVKKEMYPILKVKYPRLSIYLNE